jgi:hypothetical protein
MDDASKGILETIAASEGLVRGQAGVGVTFVNDSGVKAAQRSAADLNLGGTISEDAMKVLGDRVAQTFGDAAFVTHTKDGVRIGVMPEYLAEGMSDPKAWQGEIRKIAKEMEVKPEFGLNSGLYVGDDTFKPSAYMTTLDAQPDHIVQRADDVLRETADGLEQIDARLVKEFPDAGQRSEIIQQTRRALAEGGLARVRELIRQGVLPAVVGAAALGVALQSDNEPSGQFAQPLS